MTERKPFFEMIDVWECCDADFEGGACFHEDVSEMREKYEAKVSGDAERIAELEARIAELEDRLQIEPGGSDKIDELETACDMLRFRAEKAEARIRELTEWIRGEPDNNARHWALVLHDSSRVPRVMQWEPRTSRWCVSGGHYDPYECVHTVSLPEVSRG